MTLRTRTTIFCIGLALLGLWMALLAQHYVNVNKQLQQNYEHLHEQVVAACSPDGAAAQLDLSAFVPVCKKVLQ